MTDIKTSLLSRKTWIRIAYMALFLVLLVLARSVLLILVILQMGIVVISGADNEKLRELGQSLSKWVFQTLLFVTFNSEKKSFPFDDWPEADFSEGYSNEDYEPAVKVHKQGADNKGPDFDESAERDEDVPSFTESSVTQDLLPDENSPDIDKK